MKNKNKNLDFRKVSIFVLMALLFASCKKPEHIFKISPLQAEEGSITYSTAILKGEIVDIGSEIIEEYGIAISKSSSFLNPETKSYPAKATIGIYQVQFSSLEKATVYYYKAFAIVNGGLLYSVERKQFTTKDSQTATVVTGSPSNITVSSAILNGEVTSDGGDKVNQRGFCWNSTGSPDLSNCIDTTVNGSGTGTFSGLIDGLNEGTEYFVRAYAINDKGISYDINITSFHTIKKPTVITKPAISTSPSEASGGGDITEIGWSDIISRGVCWNTSVDPIVTDHKSDDGPSGGSFSSILSNLQPGTLYYVRAYATNAAGTSYGQNVNFNTKIADIDGNTYNTVTIGTQVWMAENLKTTRFNDGTPIDYVTIDTSWQKITSPAYCWYNNDGATYKNVYGALYYLGLNTYPHENWYGSKNICPVGWRIPFLYNGVNTLLNLYGGGAQSAISLKEAGTEHWTSDVTGADNVSGFTALPGGYRDYTGIFKNVGYEGIWWTNERVTPSGSYRVFYITADDVAVTISGSYINGYSIRCLKEN